MRAIVQNVPGVLRVESPPFRTAEYVLKEDGSGVIRVRIQFAFDAVRAVSEGRPTVILRTKASSSRTYQNFITPESVSLRNSAQSLNSFVKSEAPIVKQVKFDLLNSIPDTSIYSLRNGEPVSYNYLRAVRTSSRTRDSETRTAGASSTKEIFTSLISAGVDPARLRENFPLPDPVTGRRNTNPNNSRNFFTTSIDALNENFVENLLSNYILFEQDVEFSTDDFFSSSIYEFEYSGLKEISLSLSRVSVSVNAASLRGQIANYPTLADGDQSSLLSRRISSYFAIIPETYVKESSGLSGIRSRVPLVFREQDEIRRDGESSRSRTTGNASSSSRRSSRTARQEPDIFPFYIDGRSGNVTLNAVRIPYGTVRLEVAAREASRGSQIFRTIASRSVDTAANSNFLIPLSLSLGVKYEIKLKSFDSRNREISSSNSLIYDNKAAYPGARIRLSQVDPIDTVNSSVSISAEFTDSGRQDISNILLQLSAAGVKIDSLESYYKNPDQYSEIFSFRVETLTLSNGIQTFSEELAPSKDPGGSSFTFNSADPVGTVLTVSLGMKSPDSLIPAQSNFRFGKFGGVYRRSQPSAASLERNKLSGEKFDFVDTGIRSTIFVPPTARRGRIVQLAAKRTLRPSTILSWGYDGDISEVDHFQILGASGTFECLIGTAFRNLNFEDEILSERIGITRYTVRPIYIDLSVGNSVVIYQNNESSLPNLLSPNFKQGNAWQEKIAFSNDRSTLPNSATLQKSSSTISGSISSNQQAETEVPRPLTVLTNAFTKSVSKNFFAKAPSISRSNRKRK